MIWIVLAACGLVMLLGAIAALLISDKLEVSVRTLAAFLIGAGGAYCLSLALKRPDDLSTFQLLLPMGVTVWLLGLAWEHRSNPNHIHRKGDWLLHKQERRTARTP